MIDIETKIAEVLRGDAERVVGSTGLRDRAVARARTIRRRRRGWGAAATAGLAAVAAVGALTLPRAALTGRTPQRSAGVPAGTAHPVLTSAPGPTSLPELAGAPTAAGQPDAVGTDPAVLHFDVNLAALGGTAARWTARSGVEAVAVLTGPGDPHTDLWAPQVEIFIGPDATRVDAARTPPGDYRETNDGVRSLLYEEGDQQSTTVLGGPGTMQKVTATGTRTRSVRVPPTGPDDPVSSSTELIFSRVRGDISWVLRWQPRPGLSAIAEVRAPDPALAYAAAGALRLDHAQRCAVPARLADVPAGARLTACQTAMRRTAGGGHGLWVTSGLTVALLDGRTAGVWLDESQPRKQLDAAQFQPNRTVAGHLAQWRAADMPIGLWILSFGPAEVFVSGVPEDVALRLAGGLRVADDLAHPATWPERAVSS